VIKNPWRAHRHCRGLLISFACCVSAQALQQPRQASPERVGEYSQTRLFYRGVQKSVNPFDESYLADWSVCFGILRYLSMADATIPVVEIAAPSKPTRKRRRLAPVVVLCASVLHFIASSSL
jgi:hypothetical protein